MLIRHGDVLLEKIETKPVGKKLPKDAQGRTVLALGETTGHGHRIDSRYAALYEHEDATRTLVISKRSALTHEEHATVILDPGFYKVRIKRQYSPEGWAPVAD